ncbi:MAG: fibronectin type III domain-containing protein, partial [Fimbriimonadales bacterium]|nr:fibronectin type III domain-containing protein [Fimbriimonadales bacterium]
MVRTLWLIGLWMVLAGLGYAQAVPRSVEAIPRSPTRITLYWLPPRHETPIGYRVFLDGAPVAELDASAKHYDFIGLTPAREYRLAVQALYADGRASALVERV